jgi:hypothetical protein
MKQRQQGNVMGEALLVFGLLTGILTAIHLTGRWQFEWRGHQLITQTQATALSLDHNRSSLSRDPQWRDLSASEHDLDHTRRLAEKEFLLGQNHWLLLQHHARFKQHAWRLVGTGQASTDADVTNRLASASTLWMQTNAASQRVVTRVQPSLEAIEAALRPRGSMTDWLGTWQGSSPADYLTGQNLFGDKPGLIGRFIEEALPW